MKFYDRLLIVSTYIGAYFLLIVTLVIAADISVRKLGMSITWAPALGEYSLVWMGLLAAAWVLKHNGHITLTFVIDRLRGRTLEGFMIAANFLGIVASFVLFWYGLVSTFEYFVNGDFFTTGANIPRWIVYIVIPYGGGLLCVQFLLQTLQHIKQFRLVGQPKSAG